MVLFCCFDWYEENQREAFDKTAEGKKRGLRESFQPGAALIEGVAFAKKRPSDIDKELASKEAEFNNTRKRSKNSLRVLSFSFSRQLMRQGWKDRFKRLMLTHNELARILHRAFKAGYWRDDVEKAAARAFRIADSATADGLARSPLAYASHLFKLELEKCRSSASECVDRARRYWTDQVTFAKRCQDELASALGETPVRSYPPRLIDACERYGIKL
ncbi:hypothetical protein ACFSW8_15285 [Rubritalea tangerina]|uniref:Uncharacterized protein n=4 Tax=Rubritalea tangerina TaxID=430798 RepID=A0ABW4ZEE7_9BACT